MMDDNEKAKKFSNIGSVEKIQAEGGNDLLVEDESNPSNVDDDRTSQIMFTQNDDERADVLQDTESVPLET